jgi:hypothetical protein
MTTPANLPALERHYRNFFAGHEAEAFECPEGPLAGIAPWLRVLRFGPGPRTGLWSYVSLGAHGLNGIDGQGLEFVVLADEPDPGLVELLAMTAYFSHTAKFGVGHTVPIGRPWREGSKCDELLLALPYPLGPELEEADLGDRQVRVLWLLPITRSESRYRHANDLEALESLFDEAEIEFWNVDREPVA